MKAYLRLEILSGLMILPDEAPRRTLFIAVPEYMLELNEILDSRSLMEYKHKKMEFEYRRKLTDDLVEYEFTRIT